MALDEVRKRIDQADSQIKPLFMQRMECAREVAAVKAKTGGMVFVPEREQAIIDKRAGDAPAEFRLEYEAFLRHLISLSRRYQYTKLTETQDAVVNGALAAAGLDGNTPHSAVDISFTCAKSPSYLSVFANMADLDGVQIQKISAESTDAGMEVSVSLTGSVLDANMRCLLCQTGSENANFKIRALH